jgi:hypothetical protein
MWLLVCVRDAPGQEPPMRPEYVTAALQIHTEARWVLTGTAMLLRHPSMDWELMTYLARTCRFAGLARVILEAP